MGNEEFACTVDVLLEVSCVWEKGTGFRAQGSIGATVLWMLYLQPWCAQ